MLDMMNFVLGGTVILLDLSVKLRDSTLVLGGLDVGMLEGGRVLLL